MSDEPIAPLADGPYRSEASPYPLRFPLTHSVTSGLHLLGTLASIALSVAVFLTMSGALFVVLVLSIGPEVAYVLARSPRVIEVHADRVVLRSWLRPARTLRGAALFVQQMPDELVLIHECETYTVAADVFPGDSFERCAQALRPVAARFLRQTLKGDTPARDVGVRRDNR